MDSEHKSVAITTQVELPPSEILFCPDKDKWAIKITKDGIFFNREMYPESGPDDFAICFIELLEKSFTVTFEKRKDDTSA